jgi:membrane protein implicated in regulation of membrane protease activity
MSVLALFVVDWPSVYLVCLLVGFTLSVLSLLVGVFHLHLPGGHLFQHGHAPHFAHGLHVHAHGAPAGAAGSKIGADISPFNFSTLMAFLAWFGGVGYLLTSVYKVWYLLALGVSLLAGLAGGGIVFWYLVKVMMAHDHTMDPEEFRIVGAVGTITNPIRAGGTGELVYVQGGSRKTAAARAEDGAAIPKGSEVAVTRFEKGIAYVRPWEELAEGLEPAGGTRDEERK